MISFIKMLLLPPASLFLLCIAGKAFYGKLLRVGQILTFTSFIVFFALCTGFGARLLVAPLEAMTRPVTKEELANSEAIVLLSAGELSNAPEYDGNAIPDYIALARMRYAAQLHRQTGLPILVSGGSPAGTDAIKPLAAIVAESMSDDFNVSIKWREVESRNTLENAKYSAAMLQNAGIKRILLVTDAMHMHRAFLAFTSTNLEVIQAPTIFFSHSELGAYALIPSAESLRRSYYAIYQWLGIVQHHLRNTTMRIQQSI